MNHLTVLEHLEPPVAHGYPPDIVFGREYSQVAHRVRDPFNPFCQDPPRDYLASLRRSPTGSIAVIINWSHYGDYQVASLRRLRFGSIAPIIYTDGIRKALQSAKTGDPLPGGDGSMSAAPVKNIAASEKNRLLSGVRQNGKRFQTRLTDYGLERFLCWLYQSPLNPIFLDFSDNIFDIVF